jgi:hypothetical protein
MNTDLYQFASGGIMMGCWVVGLFFMRFWKKSGERLFGFFAVAFWILACERLLLALVRVSSESQVSWVYLMRLVAFLLILFAVTDKNRK